MGKNKEFEAEMELEEFKHRLMVKRMKLDRDIQKELIDYQYMLNAPKPNYYPEYRETMRSMKKKENYEEPEDDDIEEYSDDPTERSKQKYGKRK